MNHDVSTSVFIKEPFDNYLFLSRHYTQCQLSHAEIFDDLIRGAMANTDDIDQPLYAVSADVLAHTVSRNLKPVPNLTAQSRHCLRKLLRTPRRFAEPEGNRGWLAGSIFHAHGARLDALDAIGGVAELKDVSGQTLDRKVFVQSSDKSFGRLQNDSIVRCVRDRAAAGDGCETRSAAGPQT